MATQAEQLKAAIEATKAIADAIQELGSVPSGELYARTMQYLSFENYEAIITTLIRIGVVRREQSHLLVWTGPAKVPGK